jgi:hypothetical protein
VLFFIEASQSRVISDCVGAWMYLVCSWYALWQQPAATFLLKTARSLMYQVILICCGYYGRMVLGDSNCWEKVTDHRVNHTDQYEGQPYP